MAKRIKAGKVARLRKINRLVLEALKQANSLVNDVSCDEPDPRTEERLREIAMGDCFGEGGLLSAIEELDGLVRNF